jgi:hypothetical protein
MFSYEFYKVLHISGVFMVLTGLAGILAVRMVAVQIPDRPRRLFFLFHGLGLIIALVGGFGLAARMGMMQGLPMWVYAKLAIWVILGGAIVLAKRRGQMGGPMMLVFLGLGALAAWLAVNKPF